MKATLVIVVNYDDAQGPRAEAIEAQLSYAAKHLAENGLLSGDSDNLLVDEWDSKITISVVTDEEGNPLVPTPKDDDEFEDVELRDASVIEAPDENGVIRRRDMHGNTEQVWTPGDEDYQSIVDEYFEGYKPPTGEDDEEEVLSDEPQS